MQAQCNARTCDYNLGSIEEYELPVETKASSIGLILLATENQSVALPKLSRSDTWPLRNKLRHCSTTVITCRSYQLGADPTQLAQAPHQLIDRVTVVVTP